MKNTNPLYVVMEFKVDPLTMFTAAVKSAAQRSGKSKEFINSIGEIAKTNPEQALKIFRSLPGDVQMQIMERLRGIQNVKNRLGALDLSFANNLLKKLNLKTAGKVKASGTRNIIHSRVAGNTADYLSGKEALGKTSFTTDDALRAYKAWDNFDIKRFVDLVKAHGIDGVKEQIANLKQQVKILNRELRLTNPVDERSDVIRMGIEQLEKTIKFLQFGVDHAPQVNPRKVFA